MAKSRLRDHEVETESHRYCATLRRNLITVPACEKHNAGKSGDDEYFLWVLNTNICANAIAQNQWNKLARAYHRRPALGDSILDGAEEVDIVASHSGRKHEALQAPLDETRFNRMLDLIARGIYCHHFDEQWLGSVDVHADFVDIVDSDSPDVVLDSRATLFDCARKLFAAEPRYGDNPDVFYYQVHEPRNHIRCLQRMVFYGGCSVTVFCGKSAAKESIPHRS